MILINAGNAYRQRATMSIVRIENVGSASQAGQAIEHLREQLRKCCAFLYLRFLRLGAFASL